VHELSLRLAYFGGVFIFTVMKWPLFLLFMASLFPSFALGVEDAYPRTAPGDMEVKSLPAARLMVAESAQAYFSANNNLFGKLFRYISKNSIPMTAPVEARLQPGVMVFYMDTASAKRVDLLPGSEVKLQDVPVRQVASIGIRGSYSEENFREAEEKLRAWVKQRTELEVTGEAYGVYWNSPFVPFLLKQSEVHLPVREKPKAVK
jgi:effector-binding domain-containing protein